MGSNLVLVALLCFITWMSSAHATHGPVSSCCLIWSTTKVESTKIKNYTIQSEGICPIKAVVFQTQLGKRICSDPNSNWAIRVIQKVDAETKALLMKGHNEEGSASDITPAVSTSKNAPRKRSTNGKRRQKKRLRRTMKRMRKRV